jgi:hypothetical protein
VRGVEPLKEGMEDMRGMAGKYEMRLGIDGSETHLPMGVQVRGAYASSFINDKRHIYVYEPGGARGAVSA